MGKTPNFTVPATASSTPAKFSGFSFRHSFAQCGQHTGSLIVRMEIRPRRGKKRLWTSRKRAPGPRSSKGREKLLPAVPRLQSPSSTPPQSGSQDSHIANSSDSPFLVRDYAALTLLGSHHTTAEELDETLYQSPLLGPKVPGGGPFNPLLYYLRPPQLHCAEQYILHRHNGLSSYLSPATRNIA